MLKIMESGGSCASGDLLLDFVAFVYGIIYYFRYSPGSSFFLCRLGNSLESVPGLYSGFLGAGYNDYPLLGQCACSIENDSFIDDNDAYIWDVLA